MKTIYASDGVGGLYQGIGISLFSNFIYRGLYFGTFDAGKEIISDYQNRSFLVKWVWAQFVTIFSETVSYPFDTVRRR